MPNRRGRIFLLFLQLVLWYMSLYKCVPSVRSFICAFSSSPSDEYDNKNKQPSSPLLSHLFYVWLPFLCVSHYYPADSSEDKTLVVCVFIEQPSLSRFLSVLLEATSVDFCWWVIEERFEFSLLRNFIEAHIGLLSSLVRSHRKPRRCAEEMKQTDPKWKCQPLRCTLVMDVDEGKRKRRDQKKSAS